MTTPPRHTPHVDPAASTLHDDMLPEHAVVNRDHWNAHAHAWVASGERNWATDAPTWGIWEAPESELQLLPADMTGLDAVELGCGTGYGSAWMTRRGARVTGVDVSERQLATARRLAGQHDLPITWVHGNAEATPFADDSFDFALSEYGAALWCDPLVWIPEAARIVRPGGRLVFLSNHPLALACSPADGSTPIPRRLERSTFDLHRIDWRDVPHDPGGIEFTLPLSQWSQLFQEVGFEIVRILEPRPSQPGDDVRFFATRAWAFDHPSEIVFDLRKPLQQRT